MELEELRQRLLLRSKSADIPPIAHPVHVPEVALSQAAGKIKWETSLAPEVTARIGNGAKAESAKESMRSTSIESDEVKAATVAAAPEPISMLANTVDQLSEPTEAFREDFAKLGKLLDPMDLATRSTEQALKRIAGLHEHLAGLAKNFQSVRAFAEQVKTLSASFEPMKGLDAQLDLVVAALYANVREVGGALAPVKNFQGKVRQLASALEAMEKLEEQILGLAETFRPVNEKPAMEPSLSEQKPASVARAA